MEDNRGNSFDAQGQSQFNSDNAGNYSPSASFNYTNGKSSSQSGTSSNRGRVTQHPKRRNERFKRENTNQSDKLIKQNDMIIKLLREIRDRLPEPAKAPKKPKPQRKQSIYRFDESDATPKESQVQEEIVALNENDEAVAAENTEDQTSLDLNIETDNSEEVSEDKE